MTRRTRIPFQKRKTRLTQIEVKGDRGKKTTERVIEPFRDLTPSLIIIIPKDRGLV